jgi:hypothetical protein
VLKIYDEMVEAITEEDCVSEKTCMPPVGEPDEQLVLIGLAASIIVGVLEEFDLSVAHANWALNVVRHDIETSKVRVAAGPT